MCPAGRHRPQVDPTSDVKELNEISLDGKVNFEMVDQFCYLGDMIGSGACLRQLREVQVNQVSADSLVYPCR